MTIVDHNTPLEPLPGVANEPWVAVGDPVRDLPGIFAIVPQAVITSASVDVRSCCGVALEQAAFAAFDEALERLGTEPARVWAFLPAITDSDYAGMDRYMRMNQGRRRAYASRALRWFPAGTCVGHSGSHLVVHALGLGAEIRPVENPRQRPAWRYSCRFGPQAPPFTRGVVVNGMMIASGTASVVDEETLHPGDLPAQWDETMRNLDALSEAAGAKGVWRSVRIYTRSALHRQTLHHLAASAFGCAVERVLIAPLCRTDLLVEVEGVRIV